MRYRDSSGWVRISTHIFPTFSDPSNESEIEAAVNDKTKALFVETLGNPNSNVGDIEKWAEIAHRHNIP